MHNKGRIRQGADADLCVFDPAIVIDQSTYTDPLIHPKGIPYVLVNGVLAVEDGKPVPDVRPGRAIRAEMN